MLKAQKHSLLIYNYSVSNAVLSIDFRIFFAQTAKFFFVQKKFIFSDSAAFCAKAAAVRAVSYNMHDFPQFLREKKRLRFRRIYGMIN